MPERATPPAGRQVLPDPRAGHVRRPPEPAAQDAPALPLQGARPAAPGLSRLLAERLLEPAQLLDEAARAVAESLGGPCVISLLARDSRHGTVSSHHSEPAAAALLHDTLQDISQRGGHGAPGRGALVSGRSRLITSDEPTGLHEHVNPALWPYLEQYPVRGLLWVPLRARGESLGILVVGRDAGRPAFTPDDLARCQDVADRVGLAADNARLLSQARHELVELRRAQAELVQSGERYHALYHGNPVPMFTWQQQDDDLILMDVNAAAVEDSGGAIENLIGVRASDLYTAADAQLLEDFRQVLIHHQPVHREMTYSLRTSGEMRHLLVTLVYLPVGRVVVHTENLTELRRTEQAYRDLIDRLPAVVYVAEVGPDGSYTFVSPQIRSVLGCSPEQLLADPSVWRDRIHPEDCAAVRLAEDRALAGDRHVNVEYRLLHPDGRTLWIRDEAVVRPVDETDPGSALVIQGLMSDITERKEFLGRLQHLADHDALTGLHNRRRFVDDLIDEMARARRDGRPSSLLLIDVDDFKQVNDSLGHPVGDDLIRSLASQLRRRLRRTDALGRLGGDEFAVALPGSDTTEAAAIAEQLRAAVEQAAHPLGPEPLRVTLSIGVADAAGESATADDVLAAADLALYDAKRHGRNQVVVYEPRLTVELATGRSWRLRLQDALEQDRFVMHAQPIVSLTTEQVTQQELLLRLVEEDGTVVEAAEFLPHAERAGMMGAVDRWVVRCAVRLAADHASSGDPGLLSVNLAGSSIGDHGLVDLLRDELDATGADPSLLVFEVTETSAIADMQQAQEFAAALRALGCRLALDDFGSGFASFYYVKHLPFDFLKIDGEFVRGLRDDPLDQAVVAAIVAVARGLGRQTIAEFVGDEQTVTLLRELGVDYAQGYHLGRAAPLG